MGGGQTQERQQPCVLQEKIKEMDSERTGWASVKNLSPQPRQEDRETRLMFPRWVTRLESRCSFSPRQAALAPVSVCITAHPVLIWTSLWANICLVWSPMPKRLKRFAKNMSGSVWVHAADLWQHLYACCLHPNPARSCRRCLTSRNGWILWWWRWRQSRGKTVRVK